MLVSAISYWIYFLLIVWAVYLVMLLPFCTEPSESLLLHLPLSARFWTGFFFFSETLLDALLAFSDPLSLDVLEFG